MQIKIHNYEIMNFESQVFVISSKGISKITSGPMAAFLSDLRGQAGQNISPDHIENELARYGLDIEHSKQFINNILDVCPVKKTPNIGRVIVCADWGQKIDLKRILQESTQIDIDFLPFSHLDTLENNQTPALIVISQQTINYSTLPHTYYKLAARFPNGALCIAHFTPGQFSLSQPFLPAVGNPCFFCGINHAFHFEAQADSSSPWIKILAFCATKNTGVCLTHPDALQETLAATLIARRIDFFTETKANPTLQDQVLNAFSIDLQSGLIKEHTPSHWPMCECLRLKNEKHTA